MSRAVYRPSGKLHWGLFALWSALTVAGGALLGLIAFALISWGIYILTIFSAVAGVAIGGLSYCAVRNGHCRNATAAVLVAIFAIAIYFCSYYYAGFVADLGLAKMTRAELFPSYVQQRMENDLNGVPVKNDKFGIKPVLWENWGFFAGEFAAASLFAIWGSYFAATSPYREDASQWMAKKSVQVRGVSASGLRNALASDSVEDLLRSCELFATAQPGGMMLTLYYLTQSQGPASPLPMYLSFGDISGWMSQDGEFQPSKIGKPYELRSGEIAAISQLFAVAWAGAEDGTAENVAVSGVPFVEKLHPLARQRTLDQATQAKIKLRSMLFWYIYGPILVASFVLCAYTSESRNRIPIPRFPGSSASCSLAFWRSLVSCMSTIVVCPGWRRV